MKEKKENRRETEDIMSHFSFPEDLRQETQRQLTRGVDLDSFVGDFPQDLKMEIKRHISLPSLDNLIVPIFKEMDKHLLDAMCDRLKPVQYTSDNCLVREGDPVREILFITDGKVVEISITTTDVGIRTGAGGLCGKELFLWAFDPKRSQLPFSTTTVKAVTDVQAFALVAHDLLFLASQFHIGFQYTFRFYIYSPHNWRTLAAACRIQAAWWEHRKRKQENTHDETSTLSLGASIYVSRFSTNALRNLRRNHYNVDHVSTPTLELMRQNPTQPMTQQSLHSDDGPHLQIKIKTE